MAQENAKRVGVGLGVAAAAAAGIAAGYYFYASEDAKKNRRIAAKWASDFKSDIVKQAKKVEHLDRAQMMKIINGAIATYETVRTIDKSDLDRAARELKNNWQLLAADVPRTAKKAATAAKKKVTAKKSSAKKSATKKSRR
jgi:hypothetical protein